MFLLVTTIRSVNQPAPDIQQRVRSRAMHADHGLMISSSLGIPSGSKDSG
jgi:hypothetical protein